MNTQPGVFIRILLFLLCLAAAGPAWSAGQSDKELLDAALSNYGKRKIVELILSKRNGVVTIDTAQGQTDFHGMPNMAYVTAGSISRDLQLAKIGAGELDWLLSEESAKPTPQPAAASRLQVDKLTLQLQEKQAEIASLNNDIKKLQAAAKCPAAAVNSETAKLTQALAARDQQIASLTAAQTGQSATIESLTQGLHMAGLAFYVSTLLFLASWRMASLRRRLADMFIYGIANCQRLHKDERKTLAAAMFGFMAYIGTTLYVVPEEVRFWWLVALLGTIFWALALYCIKHSLNAKLSLYLGAAMVGGAVLSLVPFALNLASATTDSLLSLALAPENRTTLLLCLYFIVLGGMVLFEARSKQKVEEAYGQGKSWWR